MGTVSLYTFVAGSVPTASQWNQNPVALAAAVNGQLDEANADTSNSDGLVGMSVQQTKSNSRPITGAKDFTGAIGIDGGNLTFNESSADVDARFESNGLAYAAYLDGGKDALVFGSNTDVSSADTPFLIDYAARTASATTNFDRFKIGNANAITIPSGTTALVTGAHFTEPNLTATGTITKASTVYIAGAPTEAGTNYALLIDSGATQLDGTLTVGVDDSGADVKFHGASAGAYLLYDESADTLDVRGATAAGAGTLKLTTGELTVENGDILGRIDFQAPLEASGTDAVLVGASIWAEADDTFGTALNDTDLVFAVAESETAAERMRLSYDGTNVALAFTGGDLTITSGGGDISFDNENLSTTGTLASGALTVTGAASTTGNIHLHTNNTFFTGDSTGGGPWNLVGIDGSNDIIIGETSGALNTKIYGGAISFIDTSTTRMTINAAGAVLIGDSANSYMTQGLTINQGTNDNEIMSLKSSTDVVHDFTDTTEADTYGVFRKHSASMGGLHIMGFAEGNQAGLGLHGCSETADSTHTSSGVGCVRVYASDDGGSDAIADLSGGENIISIHKGDDRGGDGLAVFFIDAAGNYWFDGAAQTAFDSYDDAELVRAVSVATSPADVIRSRWDEHVKYNEQDLIDADILGGPVTGTDGEPRGMVNGAQLQRLHNGAIWQLHTQLMETLERLDKAENKLAQLTA
jgi:hypothetical protein